MSDILWVLCGMPIGQSFGILGQNMTSIQTVCSIIYIDLKKKGKKMKGPSTQKQDRLLAPTLYWTAGIMPKIKKYVKD